MKSTIYGFLWEFSFVVKENSVIGKFRQLANGNLSLPRTLGLPGTTSLHRTLSLRGTLIGEDGCGFVSRASMSFPPHTSMG